MKNILDPEKLLEDKVTLQLFSVTLKMLKYGTVVLY